MLGERLKILRSRKGLTLVRLEEVSGVSYVQIGRYEKGKAVPNGATIKKLADALGVTVESILRDSFTAEAIKDEELDEKFQQLKEVLGENDSSRRTLRDIFDLMLFQGDIVSPKKGT